jgi:transposase-like protein
MSNENEIRNHSLSNTWIRVCPRCVSTQIDLHLYGRYSQQLYKCLDCEYVGIDFIQVDLPTLKQLRARAITNRPFYKKRNLGIYHERFRT